jgi:predicted methyltransferase
MRLRLFIAAALSLAAGSALARPADYQPAIAFKGRPADAVALDASRRPADVLDFMGLKKGMRAVDVMTGAGYYAEIMAQAVGPKGSVVAWEPQNFAASAKAKLDPLLARESNVKLVTDYAGAMTPDTFDFAMIHLNYHDFYWESEKYQFPRVDPDQVLATLYAAMKPGGIVAVVDHVGPAGDTRAVVDKLHRIDPETVKADFRRAGFVLDGESDLLRVASDDHTKNVFDPAVRGKTDRFVMRFRKPKA